jgi:hypothetical protein
LDGVYIRTGSGERVLFGLVCKIGEFTFVSDNAGCFANNPFRADGFLMMLGSFVTYVATEVVREYPAQVLVDDDTPAILAARGQRTTRPESCVPVGAPGKGDAGKSKPTEPVTKSVRPAKPTLERDQPGTSELQPQTAPLVTIMEKLATPVDPEGDVVLTAAELEAQRLELQREAKAMAEARKEFDRNLREYNAAHRLTPVAANPSRLVDLRKRGKGLNAEIARDARSTSGKSASRMSGLKPQYSSPAKTLRATEAARAELSGLTGDEWRRQQQRVNELVVEANRQNEAFHKAYSGPGGSQMVHSARAVSQGSKGQASSPHVGGGGDRAWSVTNGKNKQLQMYDPVLVGKQMAGQGNASRGKGNSD